MEKTACLLKDSYKESDLEKKKFSGYIFHKPLFYDIEVFVSTWGKESVFREQILKYGKIPIDKQVHVLDIGCGTGSTSIIAKKLYPNIVIYGIDASKEMIKRARYKSRELHDIYYHISSSEDLPYKDNQFDIIFILFVCHHLPSDGQKKTLSEIYRVLTPNGRVVICEFDHGIVDEIKTQENQNHGHDKEKDKEKKKICHNNNDTQKNDHSHSHKHSHSILHTIFNWFYKHDESYEDMAEFDSKILTDIGFRIEVFEDTIKFGKFPAIVYVATKSSKPDSDTLL